MFPGLFTLQIFEVFDTNLTFNFSYSWETISHLSLKREKCKRKIVKMNMKQFKGNLERMFDKNLTDLVRGIRNNKDNGKRQSFK